VKLSDHQDFEQAIQGAARHFSDRRLRPAIIEKDYYVTEALRAIANAAGESIIFKGGTSLSKGWDLIQRFSEDIDIFLDPQTHTPPLVGRAVNRQLKALRDAVAQNVPLRFLQEESATHGGFGRNDMFSYAQRFGGTGEVRGRVLVEAAIASGREPTETRQLRSHLAQFLQQTGVSLGFDDEGSFPMRLLHFRRTFVEKLFAIHKKVELFKKDAAPVGTHTRHYYDLYQLSSRPEVLDMLRSEEYAQIKNDYERVSKEHFPDHYYCPENMSFARSDAIFPSPELAEALKPQYQGQCELLCFGPFPSWDEVQARFHELREIL